MAASGAFAMRVSAFDLHDRAHRAALLDGHLLDRALEVFLAYLRVAGRRGAILAQQHQFAVAQRLAPPRVIERR